jgi:hypothetical protein
MEVPPMQSDCHRQALQMHRESRAMGAGDLCDALCRKTKATNNQMIEAIALPEKLVGVTPEEWARLDGEERQFLIDAHDGHFYYLASPLCAWAAPRTGNLFSMEVIEMPGAVGESVYALPERK